MINDKITVAIKHDFYDQNWKTLRKELDKLVSGWISLGWLFFL